MENTNDTNSKDFVKIVRLGTTKTYRGLVSVFCKISYIGGSLSITGVEGPTQNGDAIGSCGQITDTKIYECAPEWNLHKVAKFKRLWKEWHLNDMQAGTPEQTEALKEFFETWKYYPENDYTHQCAYLEEKGLLYVPDPRHPELFGPGHFYKYGAAWLYVEVPDEVTEFFRSLPDTDITPAWV